MKTLSPGTEHPSPDLKPWMERICRGAGVEVPEAGRRRSKLAWFGVEMTRFLKFCQDLPAGTELYDALKGYGQFLKNHEPPLEEWRIDQAREALRVFRKGCDGWRIVEQDGGGQEVKFRTRPAMNAEQQKDASEIDGADEREADSARRASTASAPRIDPASVRGTAWREVRPRFEKVIAVRRYAKRTRETYGQWSRRYLNWVERAGRDPWQSESVTRYLESLALDGGVAGRSRQSR